MRKHVESLPLVGHSRWKQIEPFVGVSRETWRKLCLAGRAPQPIRLSSRCTVWRNDEIHAYLADPLNYRTCVGPIGKARINDRLPPADNYVAVAASSLEIS